MQPGRKVGLIAAAIALAVADLYLLIAGNRVLISERVVQPGQHVVVGQWGDLAENQQASLVCTYWTGRGIIPTVFWYGMPGKDSCPFILNPDR